MSPKDTDLHILIAKKQSKICKDCAYYKEELREHDWSRWRLPPPPSVALGMGKVRHILCTHNQQEKDVDLVSGEVIIKNSNKKNDLYCKTERSYGKVRCRLNGMCGKEGRFFRYDMKDVEKDWDTYGENL